MDTILTSEKALRHLKIGSRYKESQRLPEQNRISADLHNPLCRRSRALNREMIKFQSFVFYFANHVVIQNLDININMSSENDQCVTECTRSEEIITYSNKTSNIYNALNVLKHLLNSLEEYREVTFAIYRNDLESSQLDQNSQLKEDYLKFAADYDGFFATIHRTFATLGIRQFLKYMNCRSLDITWLDELQRLHDRKAKDAEG